MKAAMEDRTPRSSGETEDTKKERDHKRGKDRQEGMSNQSGTMLQ